MAKRVRVFISSTMKDLANERDAVVRRIGEYNLEPVNAESWLPNGSTNWQRILDELQTSHIFVLILGERYGSVPSSTNGRSVTHMEYLEARDLKLPILVFQKDLGYDADRTSDDAVRRDRFRQEVGDYDRGYFAPNFRLASDLSAQVGLALLGLLQDRFLKDFMTARARAAPTIVTESRPPGPISGDLLKSVRAIVEDDDSILFAGAGMSLAAGMPSANALNDLLAVGLSKAGGDAWDGSRPGSFQETAQLYESRFGRDNLESTVRGAINAFAWADVTPAHLESVRKFKTIVTTNYDDFFEKACDQLSKKYRVISGDEPLTSIQDGVTIVKLDGSASSPGSLVLTHEDAMRARTERSSLWSSLASKMEQAPVVVIGHSMRDLNTQKLLGGRKASAKGYLIAPRIGDFQATKARGFGLTALDLDADTFFGSFKP